MMETKLLFFDIDGTLLDHRGEVSASAKQALSKLKEKGHLRFICSGRTKCMINDKITGLDFDGFVYGAGTHIEFEDKILEYVELPIDLIQKTCEILRQYEVGYVLEGAYHVYVEKEVYYDKRPYYSLFIKSLGNIVKILEPEMEIKASKITCVLPAMEVEKVETLYNILKQDFTVIVHESKDNGILTNGLVELMPKGYTKATGIKETLAILGRDQKDSIAIGDSNNDLDMLTYAGTAIVMGNGSMNAKAIADYVTTDINEDGVYQAMKHYNLIE